MKEFSITKTNDINDLPETSLHGSDFRRILKSFCLRVSPNAAQIWQTVMLVKTFPATDRMGVAFALSTARNVFSTHMRHTDIRTTTRYGTSAERDMRDAHEKIVRLALIPA